MKYFYFVALLFGATFASIIVHDSIRSSLESVQRRDDGPIDVNLLFLVENQADLSESAILMICSK